MLVTITRLHSMIVLLLGAGNEERGPQQIILPDQPKLGCYGPDEVMQNINIHRVNVRESLLMLNAAAPKKLPINS